MKRTRTILAGSTAAVFATAMSLTILAAPASAAVQDHFELEGDVLDAASPTTPDWGAGEGTSIFVTPTSNETDPVANPPVWRGDVPPTGDTPGTFFDAGFAVDFIPGSTGDTSSFTGGGSKDISDVPSWKCKTESNQTDKGDIQNAYSAVATDPNNGNLLLYFGMEKNAPNGNNNMGVWFLQDPTVGCDGTGVGGNGKAFSGAHVDGDIFLVAAFTNGGSTPTITAYQWDSGALVLKGSGGKCGTAGSADLCATTNDTSSVTTPWQTTNKGSTSPQNKTGQGTTLFADQFYEGAVDLTANDLATDPDTGDPICVNRFLFNTRSSQETTATLYDYAAGDVETCASPEIDTLLYEENGETDTALPADGDHTVTLPSTVYDTASITGGFPVSSGTVTYSLYTDNACTTDSTDPVFTNGTNDWTVNIASDGTIPPSAPLEFATADSYWWQATYEPGSDSRNEGAVSTCTEEPLVVEKPAPDIATTAASDDDDTATTDVVDLVIGNGHDFYDTATITGGYFPSSGTPAPGTVTFKLYGPFASAPSSSQCTADKEITLTPAGSETVNAVRTSNTAASAQGPAYTPEAIGWYQWTAKYNGNAQNEATSFVGCGVAAEQVHVLPVTPAIATKILLSDTVKVTGVSGAGTLAGSVVFSLHPSNDCTGTALYTSSSVNLSSGTATTPQATAVIAGTYSWKVVFTPTAGSNYTGVTTTCSPSSEEVATISYSGDSPIAP